MARLPARQVHLDFHTSEHIPGIGERFSRENFQAALKEGNVNSVTVFAKCHHGWCYYPSAVGRMHPGLNFDLTGEMVEAAHGIGVRAPIYITMGWSANDAEAHPEWRARNADGSEQLVNYDRDAAPGDAKPACSWVTLCPSGGYAEYLFALTGEICARYKAVDGLFYDICCITDACWCDACREGMEKEGFDAGNLEDAKRYYILNRQRFMARCAEILHERHPDATVFFNSGGAEIYKPQYHAFQTHFEMEDLPTTWGGYDKMPPRAKFFARTGKDYLGMTGKFHTSWGEFGGFKNPDALISECAAMMAYGARCSVGDQMHPCGEMDRETYRLIGAAYRHVEKIEPYCFDVEETARLGIVLSGEPASDEGLQKMLLERQVDFDIALPGEDLSRFSAVVLPDCVTMDEKEAGRFRRYVEGGGALVLTGDSGLDPARRAFAVDTGARYIGPSPFDVDYVRAGEELAASVVSSPFLFYESARRVELAGGEALAALREPYFSRTYSRYCSHQNTPYRLEDAPHPAAVRKGNVVYLAHPVCRMYYGHGAYWHREYFLGALRLVYRNPAMTAGMLSAGRARFVRQPSMRRYVLHLLYAPPMQRGRVSVVEDLPALCDVPVEVRADEPVRSVSLAPGGGMVPFTQKDGTVRLTVPRVRCHQIVVFNY